MSVHVVDAVEVTSRAIHFNGADVGRVDFIIPLQTIAWWEEDMEHATTILHLWDQSTIRLVFDPAKLGEPPDGGMAWGAFCSDLYRRLARPTEKS